MPVFDGFFGCTPNYGFGSSAITHNIISDVFADKEEEYKSLVESRKLEEERKIECLELTESVIAEAIYSINKEAKRQRDLKKDHIAKAYGHSLRHLSKRAEHYFLHLAKNKELDLYDIKDKALKILIKQYDLKPLGYHIFGDDKKRDYYVVGKYSFHTNYTVSENGLGSIDEDISAERKRSTPPDKAVKILLRYIKENEHIFESDYEA